MNVTQVCARTETAETLLDHSPVLAMKVTFLVEMSVKTSMNVFQVHASVEIVLTHPVVIVAIATMAQLLELEETPAMIKRRVLAGSELKMVNAQEM
jgi:hypothetical protein